MDDGYIEHLEHIRGERKKLKVEEHARHAVENGSADKDQHRIVGEGAEIDRHGKVVPAGEISDSPDVNGKRKLHATNGDGDASRQTQRGSQARGRPAQDIALYNVNDHESR